jgi:hypothetical protein
MMNCKECARKRSWPNLRRYPGICLEGLGNTTKKTSLRLVDLRVGRSIYKARLAEKIINGLHT